MKRLSFLAVSTLLLISSGCATEGFVRKQNEPLAERLSALEQKLTGMDAKIDRLTSSEASDKAMLKNALDEANKALAVANGAQSAVGKSEDAALKAERETKAADAAAQRAEKAAQKSAKIFQLEQKK